MKGCSFCFTGNTYFPLPNTGLCPMEKPVRHHQLCNPKAGTYVFKHGTGILIPLIKNNSSDLLCWALPWQPCCPAHLAAGGCYLWSSTGKGLLKLSCAYVSQSHHGLHVGTCILFPRLSFCDSKALSQGRMGNWRQQHHCCSYWSSAERVLSYHYYWWCC